jgi:hypothetical protein
MNLSSSSRERGSMTENVSSTPSRFALEEEMAELVGQAKPADPLWIEQETVEIPEIRPMSTRGA